MESLHKMSRFFFSPSLGLLLVRLVTGYIFVEHGLSKIQNIAMPVGMMMHFGFPGWVGVFIAWLEVIGGVALILGILSRPFAVALGIEMLVAVYLTGFGKGLGAHDLEFVLALNSFAIALAGAGSFRLLNIFEHDKEKRAGA